MIKSLYGHSMVNIGGDLIVIGGVSSDYSYSYSLFKMTCNNLNFEWTEITETKLKIPRSHHVSMVVPRSICRGDMKPLRRQISKGIEFNHLFVWKITLFYKCTFNEIIRWIKTYFDNYNDDNHYNYIDYYYMDQYYCQSNNENW